MFNVIKKEVKKRLVSLKMVDIYFLAAVMSGNLIVSLATAFQLMRHKKKVTEFTTFNKSNLKFFRKIIEEKNSVYEFIYDLHVTLTDFNQVLMSICSLNHTFAEQEEVENNPDMIVYLLSSLALITWLEKKKTSCSAMSAMHIGGFKEQLDDLAFFFHTCRNPHLRVTLLEQKYITDFYISQVDKTNLITSTLKNNPYIEKLSSNTSIFLNELSKRKKKFLDLESVDEFIFGCFLEVLLENNQVTSILNCSCYGKVSVHFQIKRILMGIETIRLQCRIHSKVKELFIKQLKTSQIFKEMSIQYFGEMKGNFHNVTDFIKVLKTHFHEDLYQVFLQHELPSLNELHTKIKNLTEITENILSNDALVKEKVHKRVFESQLLI